MESTQYTFVIGSQCWLRQISTYQPDKEVIIIIPHRNTQTIRALAVLQYRYNEIKMRAELANLNNCAVLF